MSILLAGGGEIEALRPIAERFVAQIDARAGSSSAKVAVVAAAAQPEAQLRATEALFAGLGIELIPVVASVDAAGSVTEGFDGGELLTADGIVIADGQPLAILSALSSRVTDVRRLVHEQVPFLGIGGGAAVASEVAILGGTEIGGVQIAPNLPGDSAISGEVRVEQGLGLVDLTVLSHAAQRGIVGLAVACCEAGLADRILALDEGTALDISEAGIELFGTGSLWHVVGDAGGVTVTSSRAGNDEDTAEDDDDDADAE
ncbi:type 1 glutamine amidotransferase family protein [Gulosibacter molinativorax]|uniref:Type 1 glutamine amidotransferase-like domain-containing protein n=1 Tax=Gulosibacter molinativorax TaxID=256821 RepID=UPI0003FADB3F|nr:Type 1 glutamine amidotransferase-like domain-containing protein [Gulosibacter molinativorax]